MDILETLWAGAKAVAPVLGVVETVYDGVTSVVNWATGGNKSEPAATAKSTGLGDAGGLPALPPGADFGGGMSGGGGSGSSWGAQDDLGALGTPNLPAIPTAPGGDLVGPVYGTQGGGVGAAAGAALRVVLTTLNNYPQISQLVQRFWDFPRARMERDPKSMALWRELAKQVPESHRRALAQFLVGFPAPVGLDATASAVFMTLRIAESGYSPEDLCCTFNAEN